MTPIVYLLCYVKIRHNFAEQCNLMCLIVQRYALEIQRKKQGVGFMDGQPLTDPTPQISSFWHL